MRDVERDEADLTAAAQALMPQGVAWPRQEGTDQFKVLAGVATTLARLRRRARALLVDAFPSTAFQLLTEWEQTLGLPDPCAGAAPTLQERRAQVTARLAGDGGQSVPFLIGHAATLGYAITIREFAPSRLGLMRLGDRMQNAPWAHALAVDAPTDTPVPFRMGVSLLGERFRAWGNAVLECEMRAVAPGQAAIFFTYS
jgi:uncharacterized protein YmfQ (DUF2313 family)